MIARQCSRVLTAVEDQLFVVFEHLFGDVEFHGHGMRFSRLRSLVWNNHGVRIHEILF
jgi:hypothetical protein